MDQKGIKEALAQIEAQTKQRKFKQSIEFMINLKGLDLNKPDSQIDVKVQLPHATGAAAGRALLFARTEEYVGKTKQYFQEIIMEPQIEKLKKEDIQKLLTFDVLLAEGGAMLTVAKHLGQQLAPKGKMPKPAKENPAEIRDLISALMAGVRVTNRKGKTAPLMQVVVGKEGMTQEQLTENVLAVYNRVLDALPGNKQNVKSLYLKKTMGPAIKLAGV